VSVGDVNCGVDCHRRQAPDETNRPSDEGARGGREKSSRAPDDKEANDQVGSQSTREVRQANGTASPMTNAAAAAELAALVSAVEQCRSRLTSLAEARLAARRSDDEGDSLLTAIYEAERGLNAAIRMLQRAQRTAR
jgi:hypothetical protein